MNINHQWLVAIVIIATTVQFAIANPVGNLLPSQPTSNANANDRFDRGTMQLSSMANKTVLYTPTDQPMNVSLVGVSSMASKIASPVSISSPTQQPPRNISSVESIDDDVLPLTNETLSPTQQPHNISSVDDDVLPLTNETLSSSCQIDLMILLEEKLNNATQHIMEMEKEYVKVLNNTYSELDKLEEELETSKRQQKAWEDRYKQVQTRLRSANEEIEDMHMEATSQWINFTLIFDDTVSSTTKTISKIARRTGLEYRWRLFHRSTIRPMILDNKRRWNRMRRETTAYIKPKIKSLKNKMHDTWTHSQVLTHVTSSLDRVVESASDLYSTSRLKPMVDELMIASHLSAVSAIEESSKVMIDYLEREEEQMKYRKRREKEENDVSAAAMQRLALNRRNRLHDKQHTVKKREIKVEPSAMNLKGRSFFNFTLSNANKVYDDGIELLPLVVVISVTRFFIVGSLLLFCGLPHPLILCLAIVNLIWRRLKSPKKKKSSV